LEEEEKFAMALMSESRSVDEEDVVKSDVGVEVGRSAEAQVELPIAFSATLLIGLGLGGVNVSGGEPRTVCHWPPPPLYSDA
jgi:hypothetical protein